MQTSGPRILAAQKNQSVEKLCNKGDRTTSSSNK